MFQPRAVLYGTFGDAKVQIDASEAAIEVDVIDSVARVVTEVKFTNGHGAAASALYERPTFSHKPKYIQFLSSLRAQERHMWNLGGLSDFRNLHYFRTRVC